MCHRVTMTYEKKDVSNGKSQSFPRFIHPHILYCLISIELVLESEIAQICSHNLISTHCKYVPVLC